MRQKVEFLNEVLSRSLLSLSLPVLSAGSQKYDPVSVLMVTAPSLRMAAFWPVVSSVWVQMLLEVRVCKAMF